MRWPRHTPGGISPYLDIKGTRILFGRDIQGPSDPSCGSEMEQWRESMKKLLELKSDILCEGYFGVYKHRIFSQAVLNPHNDKK